MKKLLQLKNDSESGNFLNLFDVVKKLKTVTVLLIMLFSVSWVQAVLKTSVSGTVNWNTPASWNPSGVPAAGDDVVIASGSTVTIDAANTTSLKSLTVNGSLASTSSRSLTVTGDVTLNTGANWSSESSSTFLFGGNFTNNGSTFNTGGTGAYTFSGANKTFSGASATTFAKIEISGTYTNNMTSLTFSGALSGNGTLTNPSIGTLNLGGTSVATIINDGTINTTGTGAMSKITNNGTMNYASSGALTSATSTFNNGIINNTGGAVLTITNNVTGIVNLTGGTITGTLTAIGNTVNFNGAAQTCATGPVSFYNVTLSGTGTKTFNAAPTINGVLSIEGDATVTVGNSVVKYATGAGTNATLQYNKSVAYAATAKEWITPFVGAGGIKIINTGAITTPGVVTVNAPISIDAGSTLNTGANGLSGSGTLTNLGNLNIGGAFSMATLNAGTVGNTVNYNGAIAQAAKPTTYSNLILSGSNVKTFATTPTVNEKLSMEGAATIAVTTGVVTYGTDATLQYNKPAASNATAEEWISPFTAKGGVVIANAGEVTLDAAKAIDSKLTINTGAKLKDGGNALSINAGAQFTNAGTLTNASPLTLNSDLVKGAGTLLNNGTLTGTATVNQAVDIAHSWYMSSPVTSTTPIGVGSGGYYDEPTATWTEGIAMTAGKGYSLVPNAATVAFSGTLNNGNVAINLTESGEAVAKHGFNLIGNPYASYLDWPTVYAANSAANMPTATMWYRTKQSGSWAFATVDGLGNTVPVDVSAKIPPMQAFWVRTEVNNSTLSLTNAMRLHNDATLNILKAPAKKNTDISRLRLTITNGINTDEALVFFNDAVSNGFDKYDSPKMSNDNVLIPEIYTMAGNEKLVINGLNNTADNQEFALGFTPGQANTFSIRVTELSNFEGGTQVFIYDNVLEKGAELTDGSPYTFTSDATPTASRFTIGFKAPSVTTNLSAPTTTNEFGVIYANGQLTVNYNQKLTGKPTLSLYNTMGQQLMTQEMNSNYTALDISLTDGVYLVSIINNGKRSTQKIAIR